MRQYTIATLALIATSWFGSQCLAAPAHEVANEPRILDTMNIQGEGRPETAIGLVEISNAHPEHPEVTVTSLWVVQAEHADAPDWLHGRKLMEVFRLPISRRAGDPEPARGASLAVSRSRNLLYVLDDAVMGETCLWRVSDYEYAIGPDGMVSLVRPERPFEHTGCVTAESDGIVPSSISEIAIAVEGDQLALRIDAEGVKHAANTTIERTIQIDLESHEEHRATNEKDSGAP